MCLQETMHGNRAPYAPSGYRMYCDISPEAVPGRGMATIVRNDVAATVVDVATNIQAIVLRIKLSRIYTICNIYLPPNAALVSRELTSLIRQLQPPFLILGDFNARSQSWGDTITNPRGTTVEDILMTENLCILNSGSPTHFHLQTATSSCIDLALCSPDVLPEFDWDVKEELFNSDHYPVIVTETNGMNPTKDGRYILKKADWRMFTALTSVHDHDDDQSIDDCVQAFTELIQNAAQLAIPRSSGECKGRPVPWWNDECKETRRIKKQALRRYQRSRTVEDKIELKRARALARNVQRKARKKCWEDFVSSINSRTPLNKVFNKIKKIQGRNSSNQPPVLEHNGRTEMDPVIVANIMASHFSNVSSSNNYRPQFKLIKQRDELIPLDFSTDTSQPINCPITPAELSSALGRCRRSAPGSDGVHYDMVKHLSDTATQRLLDIYNRIWLRHEFPSQWRTATLLPFLKPNKPNSLATSYRPIALTSCLCKLMERIVNSRLSYFIEQNHLANPVQYGFRKMRGTEDALVRLETCILDAFASRRKLFGVFFDIEKAYDTTWKHHILRELHRYGLRGPIAFFIRNFLHNRCFQVRVGQQMSASQPQEQGVPQGSVLSCTLFAVAISGITDALPDGVSGTLYVDDLAIYMSANRASTAERLLQTAINRISQWTMERGFKLSPSKTIAIQFRNKRATPENISLHLDGKQIKFEESVKFLGLTFDYKMSWKQHIQNIRQSCMKKLNLLKTVANRNWGADRTTLFRLYRSLIRPVIDYGCQIYGSASEVVLARLDPIHNAAIRICTGAFRSSPVISLYAESGEPPLKHRRAQLLLQHYARLHRLPNTPTFDAVFQPAVRESYANSPNLQAPFGIRAERVQATYNTIELNAMPCPVPDHPPWTLDITHCQALVNYKKAETNPAYLKVLFLEHLQEEHSDSVHYFTDGSKGSDGVGCASVTYNATFRCRLPHEASIFSAEMKAIEATVQHICQNRNRNCSIFSDSRSALQAIENMYSSHPIVTSVRDLIIKARSENKTIKLCWVPSHICVAGNELADTEARRAVTELDVDNIPLPHTDYYPPIKHGTKNKWTDEWFNVDQQNKLRTIKDNTRQWSSSVQKERGDEVLLTRLRIGHTLTTHGHLMERRPQPFCGDCIVPWTVLHFMAECPSYSEERRDCFGSNYMQLGQILDDEVMCKSRIEQIKRFLSKISLLHRM